MPAKRTCRARGMEAGNHTRARLPGIPNRFRHDRHSDLLRDGSFPRSTRSSPFVGRKSSGQLPGAQPSPIGKAAPKGKRFSHAWARDNGVYLVPSVYDGQSMVIDRLGRILAANGGREGVFWHEIDLTDREALDWVGHWRSIGPRDRMPPTYRSLLNSPPQPTY